MTNDVKTFLKNSVHVRPLPFIFFTTKTNKNKINVKQNRCRKQDMQSMSNKHKYR